MIGFTLTDQIPSGKNQVGQTFVKSRKTGRMTKVRYPNARFNSWRSRAEYELGKQRNAYARQGVTFPLLGELELRVSYRKTDHVTRDIPGMLDALFHLLERCEIVHDDRQIVEEHWMRGHSEQSACLYVELAHCSQ